MGAWGIKSFQNDDALDWLASLEQEGAEQIRLTFSAVLQEATEDNYIEAPTACDALAAAELVAAAHTGMHDRLEPPMRALLEPVAGSITSGDTIELAKKCVRLVLSEGSELRELWEETKDFDAWQADVSGLLQRLSGEKT